MTAACMKIFLLIFKKKSYRTMGKDCSCQMSPNDNYVNRNNNKNTNQSWEGGAQ